jgi:hypothetical protein
VSLEADGLCPKEMVQARKRYARNDSQRVAVRDFRNMVCPILTAEHEEAA